MERFHRFRTVVLTGLLCLTVLCITASAKAVYALPADDTETAEAHYDAHSAQLEGVTDAQKDFVIRLYEICLGREADREGLEGWCGRLADGKVTGADLAYGFVFSPEYERQNADNGTYVHMLYRTILGREPDEGGAAEWIHRLDLGLSRKYVFSGFVNSPEYHELCEQGEIRQGSYTSDEYCDKHEKVTLFVGRMYQYFLDRVPDEKGLTDWVTSLVNREMTGADIIYGFCMSAEFIRRDLTDEEVVDIFYRACLDRESEPDGRKEWVAYLKEKSVYSFLAKGFVESDEFGILCRIYGIDPGRLLLKPNGEIGASELQLEASRLTREFIDKHTKDSQTNAQKFRSCYNWLLSYMYYKPRGFHASDFEGPDWPYQFVVNVLKDKPQGNCYGFACTVASIAKELGYQPTVIVITADHAFVEIDGKYYDNMGGGLFAADHPAIRKYEVYTKADF